MSLHDHFDPLEMFLAAAVLLLAVIRLCGDISWSWWAITIPVWGYFVLIGIGTRFEDYL